MSLQAVTEIRKLNDHLEKLEDSLAGTDDCVMDIYCLEEKLEDKMLHLEKDLTSAKTDITDLKDHLNSVTKELNVITDGGIENKLELLEEELSAVKAQNAELRNHLNSTIRELNNISGFINRGYDDHDDLIEQAYEIDEIDSP